MQSTVVTRLQLRIREARRLGFQIRQEFLEGHGGNWCEIGGRKFVFWDSSQGAAEQLATLDDALRSYRPGHVTESR